jgi:hypothetical protein
MLSRSVRCQLTAPVTGSTSSTVSSTSSPSNHPRDASLTSVGSTQGMGGTGPAGTKTLTPNDTPMVGGG